ncbi:gp49 [Alphaproteobacteria phage PhiJL001]|uniref:Gp49 n=1 Tax=Alphaproteobacteria phage PhiJL001 TaxID=2681607 RepID=Q5DN56_9CAUD|nr:gp49 [Alphaproteobacteria phage PhiJL001]AAT69525.1 gp49 [Alphaproteobacteria phage PhiJL001]
MKHKDGVCYIEATSKSGAKVMAGQLSLRPPYTVNPAPEWRGHVIKAYFNTTDGDSKILEIDPAKKEELLRGKRRSAKTRDEDS